MRKKGDAAQNLSMCFCCFVLSRNSAMNTVDVRLSNKISQNVIEVFDAVFHTFFFKVNRIKNGSLIKWNEFYHKVPGFFLFSHSTRSSSTWTCWRRKIIYFGISQRWKYVILSSIEMAASEWATLKEIEKNRKKELCKNHECPHKHHWKLHSFVTFVSGVSALHNVVILYLFGVYLPLTRIWRKNDNFFTCQWNETLNDRDERKRNRAGDGGEKGRDGEWRVGS